MKTRDHWNWFAVLVMGHFVTFAVAALSVQRSAGQQADARVERAMGSDDLPQRADALGPWAKRHGVSALWGDVQTAPLPDLAQKRWHHRTASVSELDLVVWADARIERQPWSGLLWGVGGVGLLMFCSGLALMRRPGEHSLEVEPSPEVVSLGKSSIQERDEMRRLRALVRSHGHYLRQLSLEVRTPLTAVIGYAELVKEESEAVSGSLVSSDLDRVNQSARQVLEILDDVVAMTRIRDGECRVSGEVFRLDTVLLDVVGGWRAEAGSHATALNVLVDDDAAGTVFTDRGKVKHIVRNLVGRAVRATTDGRVDIRLMTLPADIPLRSIEILDSGLSLSPDRLEGLVGDWYGQHTGSLSPADDSPIGLRVAREYISLLGGSISVEYRQTGGTAIRVVLPSSIDPQIPEATAPK